MIVGDETTLRCPKCKSRTFSIFEKFEAFDLYTIIDGRLVCLDGGQRPQATGVMHGECDGCAHTWRIRRQPHELAKEDRI